MENRNETLVERGYALLFIPSSGLFYDGVRFYDGHRKEIKWNGALSVYSSYEEAEAAEQKLPPVYRNAGRVIILPFTKKQTLAA